MEAVREITEWEGDFQPNHTYLLEGDRILAYQPRGSKEVRFLSGVMKLDRRGRKFEPADQSIFDFGLVTPQSRTLEVEGSKGHKYIVDLDEKSCTCPGFTFRGTCKHTKDL